MPGEKGRRDKPPRLNDERRELLLSALTAGLSIRASAETAGVGERTVMRYLARGEAAQTIIDTHVATLTDLRRQVLDRWDDTRQTQHYEHQLPTLEHFYWHLWQDIRRARARAETTAIARIREAGAGYDASETVTESKQVVGKDGQVVTLTTTRTTSRRMKDWRAEAWVLEHGFGRDDWFRKPSRVEVSGAEDGPPIRYEGVDAARAEAQRALSEFEQRRRQQLEAGDVIDVETSENGQG